MKGMVTEFSLFMDILLIMDGIINVCVQAHLNINQKRSNWSLFSTRNDVAERIGIIPLVLLAAKKNYSETSRTVDAPPC
jgi:hypothetical protein